MILRKRIVGAIFRTNSCMTRGRYSKLELALNHVRGWFEVIFGSAKKTEKRNGGHWGCSQCGHSNAQASQGEPETLKWSVFFVLELRYLFVHRI